MSFMWHAGTFEADARVVVRGAPAVAVADHARRRLRAQVWSLLIAANVAAWAVGLYLAGTAIL